MLSVISGIPGNISAALAFYTMFAISEIKPT
jgi:hypothetical protein